MSTSEKRIWRARFRRRPRRPARAFSPVRRQAVRILYGVVGEGMGHATRSRVVLEHLLRAAHDVRVVVSGRAHQFLVKCLRPYKNVTVDEIHGLTLSYFKNKVDRSESLFDNLRKAPRGIQKNVEVYRKVAESGFKPELVISDF